MGLLSGMVAGGAKGYADARLKVIDRDKTFDMKKQLREAEFDMQKRLKQFDSDLDKTSAQDERDRQGGLIQSADDAFNEKTGADKGGWQSDEDKDKEQIAKLQNRSDAALAAGDTKLHESLQNEIKRWDAAENRDEVNAITAKRYEDMATFNADRNRIEGEKLEAKIKLATSKAETAAAKTAQGNKKTADERKIELFLKANQDNRALVGKDGSPTADGWLVVYGRVPEVTTTTKRVPVKDEYGEDAKDEKGNLIMRKETTTTTKQDKQLGTKSSSKNPAHLFQKP